MDFNSYWYVGLVFFSLLLLIYVYFKKRRKEILLIFLGAVGVGYIIESVIYDFLGSYRYYPHLLRHKPYYDSNLGSFASNAFSLPASAVFIAVFRKNWLWILMFTGLFAVIEWLFLYLHIYKHYWWRTGYTALGLPFYYTMIKIMYQKLWQPLGGFWHLLITYLVVSPVFDTLHILPIMLFSNRYYQLGWHKFPPMDTNAFGAVYYLVLSFLIILAVKLHFNHKWIKLTLVFTVTLFINLMLERMGILHSLTWWDMSYNIILSIFIYFFSEAVSKRLEGNFNQMFSEL